VLLRRLLRMLVLRVLRVLRHVLLRVAVLRHLLLHGRHLPVGSVLLLLHRARVVHLAVVHLAVPCIARVVVLPWQAVAGAARPVRHGPVKGWQGLQGRQAAELRIQVVLSLALAVQRAAHAVTCMGAAAVGGLQQRQRGEGGVAHGLTPAAEGTAWSGLEGGTRGLSG
jgi:hypothetical protein